VLCAAVKINKFSMDFFHFAALSGGTFDLGARGIIRTNFRRLVPAPTGQERFLIRAFVATHVPSPILSSIEHQIEYLQKIDPDRVIRWVRPQGIHLTWKFLGDIREELVETILGAMETGLSDCAPLDSDAGGLGAFPNMRKPRVLWVGLDDSGRKLAGIYERVETVFDRLNFERERRAFHPHLTLGRVKRQASRRLVRDFAERLAGVDLPHIGQMRIDRVHLVRSELSTSGAVYHDMGSVQLGGA
jgi:2'-5' RNA ligase